MWDVQSLTLWIYGRRAMGATLPTALIKLLGMTMVGFQTCLIWGLVFCCQNGHACERKAQAFSSEAECEMNQAGPSNTIWSLHP